MPINTEIRELHHTLVDLVDLMNRPQRDSALLRVAGVSLDRALFPLLIVIERKGPIGVVELSELVGRDYTTISRQVAKLVGLRLINRRPSKTDNRMRELSVTAKGKDMTSDIDAARERMATALFATWSKRDLQELARLMRRFADDLQSLPSPEKS
jgi:DNA-binding MarR family transcriptional regulator